MICVSIFWLYLSDVCIIPLCNLRYLYISILYRNNLIWCCLFFAAEITDDGHYNNENNCTSNRYADNSRHGWWLIRAYDSLSWSGGSCSRWSRICRSFRFSFGWCRRGTVTISKSNDLVMFVINFSFCSHQTFATKIIICNFCLIFLATWCCNC